MLPAFFENLPYYKIDAKYSFSGDLIVTPAIIYYFPDTDLEQERINRGAELDSGPFGSEALGNLFTKVLSSFDLIRTNSPDKSWKTVMWKWGDPVEIFQSRLDALIADLKHSRADDSAFSSTLPLPGRFTTNSIKRMTIDDEGMFTLEAYYDRHDFKIGVSNRRQLHDALLEGGFSASVS